MSLRCTQMTQLLANLCFRWGPVRLAGVGAGLGRTNSLQAMHGRVGWGVSCGAPLFGWNGLGCEGSKMRRGGGRGRETLSGKGCREWTVMCCAARCVWHPCRPAQCLCLLGPHACASGGARRRLSSVPRPQHPNLFGTLCFLLSTPTLPYVAGGAGWACPRLQLRQPNLFGVRCTCHFFQTPRLLDPRTAGGAR